MKIYVVGFGPGDMAQISPQAVEAIKKSDVIVGYDCYISLIYDLIKDKIIFSSGMRKEVDRGLKAVEYALMGKTVSVISSGDAGVYGMAGLVYELSAEYNQIEIEVVPGITAALSAAAVLGAPIGHDFAVISLSDFLTDREVIKKRIICASEADFVICLYNPSSRSRPHHLEKACEYMLKYKSADTVCGYVKNIARLGQSYKICTLSQLKDEKADMFTTIIVGNSQTKIINSKMVTPRGYKIL